MVTINHYYNCFCLSVVLNERLDPGLPSLPGAAQDVGVTRVVDYTQHLLLNTVASFTNLKGGGGTE